MIDNSLPSCLALALALILVTGSAAGAAVVIDGEFDDWNTAGTAMMVPAGDGGEPMMLGATALLQDDDALYVSLNLREARNLQSMPATLALVFGSSDAAGGDPAYRGMVAVRVLEFSPPRAAGARFGARILNSAGGRWRPEPLAGSGVLSAPTYSSTRFEIRIPKRQIPPRAAALAISYWDDGQRAEHSSAIELAKIAWVAGAASIPPPSLERPPDAALRLLVWNVGGEGFERHLAPLVQLIDGLTIDLLMLDEAAPGLEAELRRALPAAWHVLGGSGGGRQRSILASSLPLEPVPEFGHLAYPEKALELLAREGTEFMRRDLHNARADGVAANAAVLDFGGRDWLLVSADLQCCGRDGSVEDRMRGFQAGVIRDTMERVFGARPGLAGALVGGDLNLVGSRTPLDILAGARGGPLRPVRALQLDGLSNHTWGPPGDRFPGGRLDFLLHPPALEVVNALVLDAADLDAGQAIAPELAAASDHLPLIVDFRVTRPADGGSSRSGDR